MVEALIQGEIHYAAENVWGEMDVGVGENDPTSGGELMPLVERVRLAEPARGKGIDMQDAEARILGGVFVHYATGGVGGAVVHGDDFVIGIVEGKHGLEGGGEFAGFIARGEDYRNAQAIFGCERGNALDAREAQDADAGADGLDRPDSRGYSKNYS
jgi:hypothetical protein